MLNDILIFLQRINHKYKQIRRIVVSRAATKLTLKRSNVRVKITAWCQLKGLVTRTMHAKYQCSIIHTSEDMIQVKVFVTDRRTEGWTDR